MSKKERSRGLIYKAVTQTMKTRKKTSGLDIMHCSHYTCMAGVCRMTKKEAQLPNPGMGVSHLMARAFVFQETNSTHNQCQLFSLYSPLVEN